MIDATNNFYKKLVQNLMNSKQRKTKIHKKLKYNYSVNFSIQKIMWKRKNK